MTFAESTRAEGRDGQYRAQLSPDWSTWAPFGGYLGAIALRAMAREAAADERPATFSCTFLDSGKDGAVDIEVAVLKRARNGSALQARLTQPGRVLLTANAWMVKNGVSGTKYDYRSIPAVDPPDRLKSYEQLASDYTAWYPIWKHIEGRPLQWFDFDRPPQYPRWRAWLRLREPLARDAALLRMMSCVMWLDMGVWNASVLGQPRPVEYIAPTLTLSLQFHQVGSVGAPFETGEPWTLVEGHCPAVEQGTLGGIGTVWSATGELLATGLSSALCRPNAVYEYARRARRSHP